MEIRTTVIDQVFIIQLSGKIDFESIKTFRLLCANEWTGKKILFDFEHLNFVGSSGITYLIESIETLYRLGEAQIGFCRPRSEFHRIFEVGELRDVPVFKDRQTGVTALVQMPKDAAIVPTEVTPKPIEIL